jgi:ribonucleoside-diphosphate reductase alpha chain
MGVMMTPRAKLPERRRTWHQECVIDNRRYVLSFGEYDDGRLGEIWVDTGKEGDFTRGIADAFARMASLALQTGASPANVAHLMVGLAFPPGGPVAGSKCAATCKSVIDWIGQEIRYWYVQSVGTGEGESPPTDETWP